MLKPAVSLAADGCEIVVHPVGSGPVAGMLTALMFWRVAGGSPPAGLVAGLPAGLVAGPLTDPEAVGPPCGEPEWFWWSSTTVAAPAPAPMIASTAMAAFQRRPDRCGRRGPWGGACAYPAPGQDGAPDDGGAADPDHA